jgi:hypothetical protein
MMPEMWSRRVTTAAGLCAVALLGPLLVPAALHGARLLAGVVENHVLPGASWSLLIVTGPAMPLWLVLLPLLPFGLIAQRRGWHPRLVALLAGIVALGVLFDLAFYLAAG